jgi:hypothetical protein
MTITESRLIIDSLGRQRIFIATSPSVFFQRMMDFVTARFQIVPGASSVCWQISAWINQYQNVQMTANAVNPFAPAESLNAQRLVPINRWTTQASQLAQQCQRYQPFWREAFWRTICANTTVRHVISTQTTNPSFLLPTDQSYGIYFDTFTRYISMLETLLAQNAPPITIHLALAPINYDFNTYLIAFSHAAPTRRFFTTRSGYMGLGPRNTQADDRVCIFDGGPVPMVLRPIATPTSSSSHIFPRRQQQQEHLLLIGECYVHGLMNGEAVAPGSQLRSF